MAEMVKYIKFATRDYGALMARPSALLFLYHMSTVAKTIRFKAKIWDKSLMEKYVHPWKIPYT